MNVTGILTQKCPTCGRGDIFTGNSFFSFEEAQNNCSHCGEKFEKEPGFFIGAMYMSYGLAVAQLFLIFGVAQFFFSETFDLRILIIQLVTILLLSPLNYRLSRVIWVYLFTKKPKVIPPELHSEVS
jgi:uncharacterized protein (DUF983 family)